MTVLVVENYRHCCSKSCLLCMYVEQKLDHISPEHKSVRALIQPPCTSDLQADPRSSCMAHRCFERL